MASGQRPQGLLHRGQRWRPGAGRWGGAGRGGVGGASSGSSSRPGAPPGARTHSVRTARRCSSWSRAGSRCSLGLRSGAGAPCTRGCASGHTQCCRLTTCSTPSTLRPLQEHSTRHVGHMRAQVCAQSTAVHAHARTHTTAGGEPRAHSGAHTHTHTHTHTRTPAGREPRTQKPHEEIHPPMATWPLASAVRGTVRAERTQTDTGGHSHRHSPVHPRRHKPKGNIPHGSRKRGRGGTKPGAHRPTDAHAQTETKVRGERTFAGLGAAAKVSGRRTGSLTPGSAGTLAHGPEGGRAPLPPPPRRQTAAQSLSLRPSSSRAPNERAQATASCPACSASCGPQNKHHHGERAAVPTAADATAQKAGLGTGAGWVWAGRPPARGLTWAHGGAGGLLEGLALAEGASVERGRVGARPCTFLPATAAAVGAGRPLRPAGPATVHCKGSTCQLVSLALWPVGPLDPISSPDKALLLRPFLTGPHRLRHWGLSFQQTNLAVTVNTGGDRGAGAGHCLFPAPLCDGKQRSREG